MDAGRLRHRVRIDRHVTERDEFGGVVDKWETFVDNVPAEVKFMSSSERIEAQGMQNNTVARVVIRSLPGLDSTMRIVYGEAVFDITGSIPDPYSGLEFVTIPVSLGESKDGS